MPNINHFQGLAKGFHGDVKATLTIEDGRVTDAVSEHHPMAYVGSLGIEQVINKIKESQSLEVDAVAGATFSSSAYLEASHKAYAAYKGEISQDQALDINYQLASEDKVDQVDAVASASINPNAKQENPSIAEKRVLANPDLKYDLDYDVVIAGSGGAGLAAAVEAARAGMKVLICEKAGIAGGTTNYSGGVMQAAGTSYQKKYTKYQDDSADKHADLWIKAGEGMLDEDLVRDLADHASENLEWLADMGIKWNNVYGHAKIPYVKDEIMADRIHVYEGGGASGSGTILTQALLKAAIDVGAVIEYNTALVSLIWDEASQTITGAVIDHQGERQNVRARQGVVLATASIDHNPALAKDLSPQHFNDLNYNTVLATQTNTGDGIMIGADVGGAINGMGGCIDFCGKTGNATDNRVPTFPMIYVNGIGQRFVCEEATYAYTYRAIFQQEKQHNKQTYMIFGDSSIQDASSPWSPELLEADIAAGIVKKADSIAELAEMIKVPASNLAETIHQWNVDASSGNDQAFGRTQGLKEITGPYYTYHNKASNLGSLGGLKINTDGQVIDNFGQSIKGLYAAGLNAGGWIGGYYPGSGTAIAGIVHQGRKAGQALARK